MVDAQVREVVRFLQSKHIKVSPQNEWLQGCCSWFTSNNPQARIQQLQEFVYDQWLLVDLREIGESCIPAHIVNAAKTYFRDKLTLQVDSVLNVGESCYSQLQKIRNVCTTNEDTAEAKPQTWEPKSKRMLRLICTDGVQTIEGMEYKIIPTLREPFIPGFKVLIIGPVECRRGILLLEPQNIQILGGEVDCLIVKNATENVLARALNLEENRNPYRQSHPQNVVAPTVNDSDEENDRPLPSTNTATTLDDFSDENDEIFLSEQLTQVVENYNRNETAPCTSAQNQPVNYNVPSTSNTFGTAPVQRNQTNPSSSNTNRPITIGNNCDNSNTRKIGIACPMVSNNPSKRPAPSPAKSDLKIARTITNTLNSSVECINLDDNEIDSFSEEFSVMTSSSENTKIKDLKRFVNSNCTRKCNAEFLRITSKPKIREEKWNFSGEIGDETGTLDVLFSDPFLEKIFEFSAVEIASQKERMKLNPDVRERIDNILKRGVQRLIALKGQFHIQFSLDSYLPKVINVV